MAAAGVTAAIRQRGHAQRLEVRKMFHAALLDGHCEGSRRRHPDGNDPFLNESERDARLAPPCLIESEASRPSGQPILARPVARGQRARSSGFQSMTGRIAAPAAGISRNDHASGRRRGYTCPGRGVATSGSKVIGSRRCKDRRPEHGRDRRYHRPRNPRQPRQPDDRGRCRRSNPAPWAAPRCRPAPRPARMRRWNCATATSPATAARAC